MKTANWFNTFIGVLIGATQVPALAAVLGPFAWIPGVVGVIGNLILHNTSAPTPPPTTTPPSAS